MRDAVIGDLEEGYAKAESPRWWFWLQVARSAVPAVRMRWRSPGILRIGVAAIASYAVVVACVVGLEAALSPFVKMPGTAYMLFSLVTGAIAAMAAGAVMVVMVPMAPSRALRIFAGILFVLGVPSAAMEFGQVPLWYSIALLVTGPAAVLVGGAMAQRSRTA